MNRKPQALASCANCWFNGLQHGSIGLSQGYCVEHKVVLVRPEETTCAKHMRKDLLFYSAEKFNHLHKRRYDSQDRVQKLYDCSIVDSSDFVSSNTSLLRRDVVGELVSDYGEYDSKIESLSQLNAPGTIRAEIAMLNLARGYVHTCVKRKGTWKSGIHLLWWTRRRLVQAKVPDILPSDIRRPATSSLERQVELAQWSLLMLRLMFISDIGVHAKTTGADGGKIAQLEDIAELAAQDTGMTSLRKLNNWVKQRGVPMIDSILPEAIYKDIAADLRKIPD